MVGEGKGADVMGGEGREDEMGEVMGGEEVLHNGSLSLSNQFFHFFSVRQSIMLTDRQTQRNSSCILKVTSYAGLLD